MARRGVGWYPLLLGVIVLAHCVPEQGTAVDEQSDAIIAACIEQFSGGYGIHITCNIQCPVQCNCSLGNFSNILVKCNSRSVIMSSVVYSSNTTSLAWDNCGLSSIHRDSFAAVADVLVDLSLHSNSLSHLQVGVFERLRDLRSLHLSLNLLHELEPGVFRGLINLIELILSRNFLVVLKPGVFDELENLERLDLQDNILKVIQAGVFNGLCNLMDLNLNNNVLTTIAPDAFKNLTSLRTLRLDNNMLTLNRDMFAGLENLENLHLRNNSLKDLQPDIFGFLTNMVLLDLNNNLLTTLEPVVSQKLKRLSTLQVSDNKIRYIKPGIFRDMKQLAYLILGGNLLEHIEPGTFDGLESLQGLNISYNKLTEIRPEVMNGMSNLSYLFLNNNQLGNLHPEVFKILGMMKELYLSNISMESLPQRICEDMPLLQVMNISGNGVNELSSQAFQSCHRLSTLDITKNPLHWIESDSFDEIWSHVLVDSSSTCCFMKHASCHPHSPRSPFLTCGRLLPTTILRIGIWIVSILAVVANVGGAVVRYKNRHKINTIQFLLITNLSISDFLMGIYLIILLSADLHYSDYFPSHSDSWRNSVLCKIAGSLSVLSSEASVFFITLISIDRFIRVKFPRSIHLISATSIIVAISVIWFVAFGISLASFMIADIDSTVYTVSEICVGLPFSRHYLYTLKTLEEHEVFAAPSNQGVLVWVYHVNEITDSEVSMYFSIVIFTVLNLGCFLIVGICYTAIFIIIRKSSKKSGLGKISKNEIRMAKKMSLIVLTDCCCWVPIGVLSIIVQAGGIEIHPVAYAWIATFVLPINSAMNPFLYTLGDAIAYRKVPLCCGYRKHKENENVQTQHHTRPTAVNKLQGNPQ